MKKRAIITGITGQDGSYLAEFLLDKGYEVTGLVRRVALENPDLHYSRISRILDKIKIFPGDIESYPSVIDSVIKTRPDELYHLAAQSFVAESFKDPFTTLSVNINGSLFVLNALKEFSPECRIYFAASSEMFGLVKETPQNENTPLNPRSPYGITKVAGFQITKNFRESYDMFALSGILFNHESPRRGLEFVTRKITNSLARIKLGKLDKICLGNLDARRDWGYSKDYVEAMWMMLQQEKPDDYVIATGETHSVREFADEACRNLDIDILWEGKGADERGICRKTGKTLIEIDKRFFRPAEVALLQGDYSKAREKLGWNPKTSFKELVRIMTEHDLMIEKGK